MEVWTVNRVLRWAADDLRQRGNPTARLDAELLLAQVLGCDRVKLIIEGDRPLAGDELEAYKALHRRRRRGEPVAYLRGEREFYGRPFYVDARVLVPRPETELLVEVAMRRSHHVSLSARVLDLCTGSGCVAITLKKERPTNCVAAGDLSSGAVEVARANCLRLGALVAVRESDLFAAFGDLRGKLDVITANPPYIPERNAAELPVDVRDFEPQMALLSGEDGLELTRRLVAEAPAMLAAGGVLAVEIDSPSGAAVARLFEEAGFSEVEISRDYAGLDRVVSGCWRASQKC